MKISKTSEEIQACGAYDSTLKEYTFSISSGGLVITFEFLKKSDIEHLSSCLSCMLLCDEPDLKCK